ncbi:MFS transporter [Actinokineospora bangkokensis]|uniref:MFS transporter n=1 Tax=Actinokineospora bangkokensis TaxID=1193682 RepID=A0A1Q9LM15_9PSEU|nr:MFS transporter [Actinokineospora bangkokensis]OLR93055.1 MFS transporter [Actinokineospora bangkokensis]
MDTGPTATARHRRGLAAVYTAGGASAFGTQMTLLALPWLVLQTTGSATMTGLLFAVQVLPMALLGFAGTAVIQRWGARRTMVLADLLRAPVIALVPVLSTADALAYPVLLAVVALLGVLGVPYFAAQRVLAAELAGSDAGALTRANSVLEGCFNTASLAGPALGGVLIALIGPERVLWADAATYLVSGLLLWAGVPAGAGRAEPRSAPRAGLLAGVRALRADDFLRPAMVSTVSFGFLLRVLMLALPLLAFARFDGQAEVGGLLVAAFGSGALVGSLLSYLVAGRLRPGTLMAVSAVQLVLPLWVLAAPVPVPVLVAALVVSAASLPLSNAPFFSILATRFTGSDRAAVMQSVITMSNIAGPLGFLVGGVAVDRLGVTTALLVLAALASAAAVNLLRATRRLRPAPTPTTAPREVSHA